MTALPGGRTRLSVVLPFYRKLEDFRRVLPLNAPFWARPGLEVVLVLDENGEEAAVLQLLARFPQVRWKVLVNDLAHPWRPPCKAINAGVRHGAGEFVLIHSPESAYVDDVPGRMLRLVQAQPGSAAIGRVGFARFDEVDGSPASLAAAFARKVPQALYLNTFYGSVCCTRTAFEAVRGYDEGFAEWGGDDDDFRIRLEMAGQRLLACPQLRLLHLSDEARTGGEQFDRELDWLRCTPASAQANAGIEDWGREVSRLTFESAGPAGDAAWLPALPLPEGVIAIGSRRQCEVCGRMVHHERPPVHCPRCSGAPAPRLTARPRIVCVMQVRNEARHLPGCLDHLRAHVDGFVVLDDGSTDATADILRGEPKLYELLRNPPHADHVWRENENKRRLLEAAARHGAGWVLVCDADERYESLFLQNLPAIVDALPEPELVALALACCELWNAPDRYRIDGVWGRKSRARLLRLPREIAFDRSPGLHGSWLPDALQQHGRVLPSWYRLYHLKTIRHEDRVARRELYKRLDPEGRFQPAGYDYLAEEGLGLRLAAVAPGRGYDLRTLPPGLAAFQGL